MPQGMVTSFQPLLCPLSGRHIQMATDSTRITILSTQANTFRVFFLQNGITWWKSPAESPDLNPIEKVWGSMKTYLRDKYKPRNLPQLKEGIKTYWSKLTPEQCAKYIDHLQKVMPIVVQEEGRPSGH